MNIHKAFIFNAFILMSFQNVLAMQEDNLFSETQEDSSCSEEELYSEEILQQLKEIKQNEIINLKKHVMDVIDKDIKSIKAQIKFIEIQDKRMERFSLNYAEEDLMRPHAVSPDTVMQAKKRHKLKTELNQKLEKKIKESNDFQKELVEVKRKNLDQLSLKELKNLYKKLDKQLFYKYAEDESDFSEEEVIISKNSIPKKAQSAEELTPFVEDTTKKNKISQDLSEISDTTLALPENNNSVKVETRFQLGDIAVPPIGSENNNHENSSNIRKIKFTPNHSFAIPSIPSFFNIITYAIKVLPTSKGIESGESASSSNNEVCISAINKAFSPMERFADYSLHPHNRKSMVKLLITKSSNNSNNFDHMIICKISQESNIQLNKSIIEILSNNKIFNRVKENHNHIPHVYHEYLQTRNKNANFNDVFAILLNDKNIFNKTKNRQISTIGCEYLQNKNKNFVNKPPAQTHEISHAFIESNPFLQYIEIISGQKKKLLEVFIESQLEAQKAQGWVNKALTIFAK